MIFLSNDTVLIILIFIIMSRPKIFAYCIFLCLLMILAACNRSNPQVKAILQQADALMEEHPDSAYSLIDSLHYRQSLSKKETALYALLLAKAKDKTYQSLIPCDSLLSYALRFYDKPTANRATALLYKGCLEDEVNHDEDAITHLQEARLILQNYPEEKSTCRITLGLLGDLYYQHKHYEDCLPVYKETLELCESDRDKSYTFKDISSYYTMTEQQDSSLYYHHKAIKHAILTEDSVLVASSYHSLALAFNVFSKVDSALYYENLALNHTPNNSSKGGIYYQIGSIMQNSGDLEQAAYYINKAKEDSLFNGSFMINRVLGKIETSLENYKEANVYYKKYIDYLDSLYTFERSVDVQKLKYDYENRLMLKNEQVNNERKRNRIIFFSTFFVFSLITLLIYTYYHFRQLRQRQIHAMREMKMRLSSLEDAILDNQKTIEQLRKESVRTLSDANELQLIIQEKEAAIKKYEKESLELSNRYFQKTVMYSTIVSRTTNIKNKKKLQIFTSTEQEQIRNEVFTIYYTYIKQLRNEHPTLKDEDLLLLCLESAGISNQAIALCFGSTDPHIVYARRARMRDRITT